MRADYVLGVVGSPPRKEGINWFVKHKIELWIVTEGPIIELIPYRQLTPNKNYRNDMIRLLEGWDETIAGGVPNRLGIGVAQDVQRRVDEYRAANPMRLGRRSIPAFRLITTATKIYTPH